MSEADIVALLHDCMLVTLKLCLPVLGTGLVVGLVVSFVQAITQINEATLAFLPKLIGVGVALVLAGPFMASVLSTFTQHVFDRIVAIGGS